MHIQVPGIGPRDAPIAFVGEQPGKYEVIQRRPFIGPAGKELDKCLQDAGIPRLECYITNVLKALDYPAGEYFKTPQRGQPPQFTSRADPYLDFLRQEISEIPANVIVAVGNIALFALTHRYGITKWRGSVLESTLLPGRKVVPIIHPATICYGQYLNRFLLIKDLITAREESAHPDIRKIPRRITIGPSYHQCVEHLAKLRELGRAGQIIDFDIEVFTLKDTPGGELVCLAFAHSPQDAFCIPFQGPGGDYFTIDQEADLLVRVAEVLEDPSIAIRGQGITFDCTFMLSKYGIRVRGELHDTMIAQKTLLPDFRVGLDFITREYTDINYYKDEGKKWFSVGGPWPQFWTYNGMDTISTAASHPKQIELLHRQDNLETYNYKRRLIPALVYMMARGTLADIEGVHWHRKQVEKEQAELRKRLDELAGRPLPETFATSPKQVADYFYTEKNIKPYLEKGRISTNADAMKRLKRRGFEEAGIVQRLRYLKTKALGTYLDVDKISSDGRYRCYWNPVGSETGRLSSSEDIFGQGTNLQNWPHELLSYLIVDPGYCGYFLDLGQAENRIVAYVGNVIGLIECFEKGIDVHSVVGAQIAETITGQSFTWQEIKAQDKRRECCDLGTGEKTWRDYGKRTGHARNYDMSNTRFSLMIETPERESAICLAGYDRLFPEVRGGYQSMVRETLMRGRTLTNLLGRKRIFLGQWDDDLFRQAYAQIPQSTVADKIDRHALLPLIEEEQFRGAELLRQIHDDVGIQIPVSLGFEAHARMLIELKRRLEQPLRWHDRQFSIPADLTQSLTWNKDDGKEYKGKAFVEDPAELGKVLEENYHKLREERHKKLEERHG